DHQQARRDPSKKSRQNQACYPTECTLVGAVHLNRPRRLRSIAPTKVAAGAAQFRISCACSNERARTCRDPSTPDPTNRRKANARRLHLRSEERRVGKEWRCQRVEEE